MHASHEMVLVCQRDNSKNRKLDFYQVTSEREWQDSLQSFVCMELYDLALVSHCPYHYPTTHSQAQTWPPTFARGKVVLHRQNCINQNWQNCKGRASGQAGGFLHLRSMWTPPRWRWLVLLLLHVSLIMHARQVMNAINIFLENKFSLASGRQVTTCVLCFEHKIFV